MLAGHARRATALQDCRSYQVFVPRLDEARCRSRIPPGRARHDTTNRHSGRAVLNWIRPSGVERVSFMHAERD